MAPVEFADKKQARRVRFVTGVFHDGVDYGPDCEEDEADCSASDAMQYVRSGRAVYLDEGPADAQQRDPDVQNRDPQVGKGLDTRSAKALASAKKEAKGGK